MISRKNPALCDDVENLLNNGENHTMKDIEFHTAIAMSSKTLLSQGIFPVINSFIPLFLLNNCKI